jgi:hypothetical protein
MTFYLLRSLIISLVPHFGSFGCTGMPAVTATVCHNTTNTPKQNNMVGVVLLSVKNPHHHTGCD